MRQFIMTLLSSVLLTSLSAQRTFTEIQSATDIQVIHFETEFASIAIETWDKNEIEIKGFINIYNNEANDSFQWTATHKGGTYYFKSETNFPKWSKNAKWDNCNQTSDIRLTVRMPKDRKIVTRAIYGGVRVVGIESPVDIKSTYGGVDVKFNRLPKEELRVESTYSHVDISIAASARATLTLKTPYGETLTDLPLEIRASKEHVVGSTLEAELNGGGTAIYAEAGYNKIYLREL